MRPVPYRPILIVTALLAVGVYAAAITIPNRFSAGDAIVANDVNENFDALETAVSELETTRTGIAVAFDAAATTAPSAPTSVLSVTVTVPAAGVIEVRGEGLAKMVHRLGTASAARLFVADTAGEDDPDNFDLFGYSAGQADGLYYRNMAATLIAEVAVAGSYTFHLNVDDAGSSTDLVTFQGKKLIATYHPSTIGPVGDTN